MSTVLIISPEPWDAHSVSKHHYAIELARRGHDVLFYGPPSPSGPMVITPVERDGVRLRVVHAGRVAPGLRWLPGLLRRGIEALWLKKLERVAGCRVGVVWLFENSRFFDMRFAGERLKIYHQVDLNQDFYPATAAATADICFCTSDFIRERLLPYQPRVFKIHHGTAQPLAPRYLNDECLARLSYAGAQAVYIGNLDMAYLDAELLAKVIVALPAVRFHLVGSYSRSGRLWQLASNLPNAVWWGKLDSALIPSILDRVDVLLVTYQAARFREQLSSPHKFMEYLASGKTVIATYTDEYKDKRHLLEMVDDTDNYLSTLQRVLTNLSDYNCPQRQAERRVFAAEHSYSRQYDKMLALLAAHGLSAHL
jgi:glycosyltransferase involved in cell wall biosynthesis